MKRPLRDLQRAVLIVVLGASPSWSQTAQGSEPVPHPWSHGTMLGLSGGVGTSSDATGAVLGGTIGWEITPLIGVEGTATWLDRQTGASAFAASLTAHATLTRSRLSPFVEGGFGMYLATFDPLKVETIPPFYADRMSGNQKETFTDPAFFVGAGFDLFRTNRIRFRPAIGAIVAFTGSQAYTVGTFAVRAEYHFADHPVGLSR